MTDIKATDRTVWDNIEDNLYSTLGAIKQVNGYQFDVREVVGWGFDDFVFSGNWPAIGVVIGEESRADVFAAWGRRCKRQVGIAMWVSGVGFPKRGEPTFSRIYSRILADLEKALVSGTSHSRGGYAEWTELTSAQPEIDSSKGLIGCFLQCTITYRHKVGDLYTQV